MTLREMAVEIPEIGELPGDVMDAEVTGLAFDSRRVKPGNLYFAYAGARVDGRDFAAQALERGAIAVVSELERPEGFGGPWIRVQHGRRVMALMARALYGRIDEWLELDGVTGTNGKTTTAFLIDAILRAAGAITALVGTIEYHLAGEALPAVNTTPESVELYELFRRLREKGGTRATMEVSSHALALGRVWGMVFHTAVFTNLTRDHLDFHRDMEDYFQSKRQLFLGQDARPPKYAVLNADDSYAKRIDPPKETEVITYGVESGAAVRAVSVSSTFAGLRFDIAYQGRRQRIESGLVGQINVYNILAAYATGLTHGLAPDEIAKGIARCQAVPGRFERIDEGQPFLVVVDYAHTDDALRNVIRVARALKAKHVLTLFGCGGDRDRNKRPLMGMAAAEGSDFVALTSDNPRSEDPLSIINDALVGLRRFDTRHVVDPDRESAMRKILNEAQPGDIVILAGKGHEPYQVLRNGTIPFDDREVARRILKSMGYGKGRA
jgi:UDP-N-acetylmuramoyl-L-alanyl-D-glutamate--2,6-diaminopimelate ligase